DLFAFDGVFQPDREQSALLRVHGGLGQLLGVHLAQALVALDGGVFLAFVLHEVQQLAPIGLLFAMIVLDDRKGWIVEARNRARQGAKAPIFGLSGEREAYRPLRFGGIMVDHGVRRMLFVVPHFGIEAQLLERFMDRLQVAFILKIRLVV